MFSKKYFKTTLPYFAFLVMSLAMSSDTFAATATGLPWESPIDTFVNSISGPFALGISILGIVMCGAGLIFGGEMSAFVRSFAVIILVISIIVGAVSGLTVLFGVSSAVIGDPDLLSHPGISSALIGDSELFSHLCFKQLGSDW